MKTSRHLLGSFKGGRVWNPPLLAAEPLQGGDIYFNLFFSSPLAGEGRVREALFTPAISSPFKGSNLLRGLILIGLVAFFAYGCAAKEKKPSAWEKAVDASMRGSEAFANSDYAAALVRFEISLELDRSVDNRQGELVDLINIARVYIALADYQNAGDRIEKAITLARSLNDNRKLAQAYATYSKVRWMAGDSHAALTEINKAISIHAKDGINSGGLLNLKAELLIDSGMAEKAEELLFTALSLNKREDSAAETANSYRALARVGEFKKTWNDALAFYSKAYDIDKPAGDPVKITIDLMGMAGCNLALKRPDEAVFLFGRAYIVSANAGLTARTVESLDKLIITYKEMGNAEKADFYSRIRDTMSADSGSGGGRAK